MTRGEYKFRLYRQALKDAVTLGMALTEAEQGWLDQGIMCGVVETPESEKYGS